MRLPLLVRSTVFWFSTLALMPVCAVAQSGQITGQIDGVAVDLALGTPEDQEPGFFINRYAGGGITDLELELLAVSDGADGFEGIMIGLIFEGDGDLALEDFTPDMLIEAEVILIEDWPVDQLDPNSVWLADLDRAAAAEIALSLSEGHQTVTGQFASSRFCLHELDDLDYTPVRRDGGMICKSGALNFAAASDGADMARPAAGPIEVEVLGRIEGMVGTDSFDWLTITRSGAHGTASRAQADDGTTRLSIQGHSPASANFLYEDVLSINIWTKTPVPVGTPIPAEVMFVVEGSGGMPRVFYTSDDAEGEVTATIWHLAPGDALDEIRVELSGRLCRVEGFTSIEGDCLSFQATATTELMDDGTPF